MPETMGWYRACLAIAALLVFWSAPVARAAEPEAVELEEVSGARAAIDDTVAKVLLVLKNGDLSLEEKRIAIETIARVRFDFYVVSRLVLAKNWKRFSPEQRKVFQSEFKIFLAQEYSRRLDDYENQGVEVLGEQPEARGDVTVLTRIMGGEFDDAAVNYRMREKDGEWYIIDVVIEGISLVSNWRDQFRAVLRGPGGASKLLAQLHAKNALRAERTASQANLQLGSSP